MRWTKAVALAATGTLALAACGGGGDSGGGGSTGSQSAPGDGFEKVPASAGFKPDAKGPAPAVPGAKTGGTFTINAEPVPENLDPSTQYFSDANMIHRLTTRRLTQYKMEGNKSVLVPDIATDLGKVSKDGLSWTYTLKKGLKYEDGTPIKASDIEYSVKRAFLVAEMPGGPTFQIEYLKGGDKYKGPWKNANAPFPGIKSNDSAGTITFNLSKKMQTFPYFASFSMFGPIPPAKDTKLAYGNKWLSTGPYKIQRYQKGSALTLVRNTNWDANSDPSRHAYPDTIQFNFKRDGATTAKSIMANKGPDQTTLSYDGVDPSIVKQALGPNKNQVAIGADPCSRWPQMTMDTQKIPLEVRKAVVMAWPTNQDRIARGWTQFDAAPGGTISVPQLPGFQKYTLPVGQNGQGNGNPTKAREMLQKAGKLNFELSYYYINDTPGGQKSQQVKQSLLTKAGFKVKGIGVSSAEYRDRIKQPTAPTNMGNGVATGWCYDWPGGDSVYPPLFTSTLQRNTGVGNVKDPKLDAEMRAISALPVEQQGPKWSALDKKIVTEIVPVVPAFYSRSAVIFGTKVHNVKIDPNAGNPMLGDIWVG